MGSAINPIAVIMAPRHRRPLLPAFELELGLELLRFR